MCKYYIVFLMLLLAGRELKAQTPEELLLLSKSKQEVKTINNQVLYKNTIAFGALPSATKNLRIVDYKNVADGFLIYFDDNKKIRKFVTMLDYPEEHGFSIHYFDENGFAIHSAIFQRSAMDDAVTGTRYMDKGNLIYLDIEKRGENDEIIGITEQYGGDMGLSNGWIFNTITHTDSLIHFCKKEDLTFKSQYKKVKFSIPEGRGETVVKVRKANVREAALPDSEIVAVLSLGDRVQIGDSGTAGWCKITTGNLTGYIDVTFVEPVEYEVKK